MAGKAGREAGGARETEKIVWRPGEGGGERVGRKIARIARKTHERCMRDSVWGEGAGAQQRNSRVRGEVHTHTHTHARTHASTHACMHARTHAHTCASMHTYTQTHTGRQRGPTTCPSCLVRESVK